uniref:Uncharacterized protein n=1 Tax=Lacticaseibacillus paracasei subsp. paracasei TaxID=47714 RepID=V5V1W5_LACPA|nr:hypothetical protein [Lacticaseibacillus paracasei subsp. paracasei]
MKRVTSGISIRNLISLIRLPKNLTVSHGLMKFSPNATYIHSAKPLEVSDLNLPDLHWVEVYYQDGLAINVMYSLSDPKKRAVGFKLSDGMAVPLKASLNLPGKSRSLLAPFGDLFSSSRSAIEKRQLFNLISLHIQKTATVMFLNIGGMTSPWPFLRIIV